MRLARKSVPGISWYKVKVMLVTRYKKTNEESCFKVKPYVPVVYYEKSTREDTALVDG